MELNVTWEPSKTDGTDDILAEDNMIISDDDDDDDHDDDDEKYEDHWMVGTEDHSLKSCNTFEQL